MRSDQAKRIRRAFVRYNRRACIAQWLDRNMESVAKHFPLCSEGEKHNWTVLFSQMFLADCQCCYFFRGITVGFFFALLLQVLLLFMFYGLGVL